MKLSAGDMVRINSLLATEGVSLHDAPFELGSPEGHVISHLSRNDTAIVVSLSNSDGRCAYIIGPQGAGWAFGAFLERVP